MATRYSSPIDDAYITFRYAVNIGTGHGFVYNVGERVLGTTTPLFALILAPFTRFGMHPDTVATFLSISCDVIVCAVLYRMVTRTLGWFAGTAAALFYALSYANIAACGFGMEAQLFILFVILAIDLSARKPTASAAMCGLAALTRPEGFVLAAILFISLIADGRHNWRTVLAPALVFLAVIGPWVTFAWLYFGSPLPHSVTAKIGQPNASLASWFSFFVARNPVVMLLWLGAAVGVGTAVMKRSRELILFGAWLVLYTLFFVVARPPFWLGHYFVPTAMALSALAGIGIAEGIGRAVHRPAVGTIVAGMLAVAILVVAWSPSIASAKWRRRVAEQVFIPLARWVDRETPEQAVVHAADIGYLGYYSGRTIEDAASLVTPDLARYRAAHRSEANSDISYVMRSLPDYVVLPVRGRIVERFTSSPDFLHEYAPRVRFQINGETSLRPPPGTGQRYARDSRFMADYIVYQKKLPVRRAPQ